MKQLFSTVIIAALVSFGTYKLMDHHVTQSAQKESAFDRVMRTKTLRCGYNIWPTMVEVDPNTQKVYGVIPDLVEYAAKSIGLKVEWTTQAGWGTYAQDLKNNRFDAMCAGAWAVKETAPYAAYTRPIFFNPMYVYVRQGELRFENDLIFLNDPKYKIGFVDGAVGQVIATEDFPKAKVTALPQLTDPSQVFMDLMYKKSDAVFMDGNTAKLFDAKNPGEIRRLNNAPYRSFPSPLLAVSIDEPKLAMMFDTLVGEMQLQGTIDRVLRQHNADPLLFIQPEKPYTVK